ncbi:DUF4293 domain-containing protein [Perlabentimonas gracilis]|uniref:DUF4293 domain-containing protein n=1 Tax=Perlabentimonas gracilis TaxID=2715279 RepID=UPI00140A85F4|nr:DUF4293 domain-containing protein [Perlabentimonas gracilis]NHB68756.1 DUF4293 domain-containing protein [Perlabentimonas gracilis]
MIQRIQTVFLLIATILMVFVVFMPVAHIIGTADGTIYELGFKGLIGNSDSAPEFGSMPMSILIGLCLGLCVATIFLFKKRMLQIRLSVVNIVLLLGLMGLMYYYVRSAQSMVDGATSYSIIFMFPLAAAILVFLALRAIARDEALVRSLDRLR